MGTPSPKAGPRIPYFRFERTSTTVDIPQPCRELWNLLKNKNMRTALEDFIARAGFWRGSILFGEQGGGKRYEGANVPFPALVAAWYCYSRKLLIYNNFSISG